MWSDQTAADLKRAGRSGLKTPVETSPKTSTAPTFLETTDNEGEANIAWTSGQESWAEERSLKSIGCTSAAAPCGAVCRGGSDGKRGGIERTGKPCVSAGGLESASATTFSEPGVCLMLVVNSEMYAKWRCWRADCGGVTRTMAATSGLWSVRS